MKLNRQLFLFIVVLSSFVICPILYIVVDSNFYTHETVLHKMMKQPTYYLTMDDNKLNIPVIKGMFSTMNECIAIQRNKASDMKLVLQENELTLTYNISDAYDRVNIAICNDDVNIKDIPHELRTNYYYSPRNKTITPGVIVGYENSQQHNFIDEDEENSIIQNICLYEVGYLKFFFIASLQYGIKFYKMTEIPSFVFMNFEIILLTTSFIFSIFLLVLFEGMHDNDMIRERFKQVMLFVIFCVVLITFYELIQSKHFASNNTNFHFRYPIILFILPLIDFASTLADINSIMEFVNTLKLQSRTFIITLLICVVTIILAMIISDFWWIMTLLVISINVVLLDIHLNGILKACCVFEIGIIIILSYYGIFHYVFTVPFIILLTK